MHIRAYTYIFILKHTAKLLSGGVLEGNSADIFWQQCEILSSRSALMGHVAGLPSFDMAWGTPLQSRGGAKGVQDAFSGGEGGGRAI